MGTSGTPRTMDVLLRLDRGIPDVPWARHELIAAMKHDHVQADPDRVGLVVTELLTNALLHGREPVHMHAELVENHLRIEVTDAGEAEPNAKQASPTDTTGRGLMLVAGLVERWGVDRSGDGKCVWAEFASPAEGTTTSSSSAGMFEDQIHLPERTSSSNGHPSDSAGHASRTAHGGKSAAFVSAKPDGQLRTTSQ